LCHRQPSEDDDRDRVGHVAAEPAPRCCHTDGARGQRVVGDDDTRLADDEGARRAAVIDRSGDVPEAEILRRLLIRTLDAEGLPIPQLIAKAKERLPGVFTHRVLAAAFHMSPGNVTHILKRLKEAQT